MYLSAQYIRSDTIRLRRIPCFLRQYPFGPECLGCGTRVRTRNTHAHYTHNTHAHAHAVRMQAGKELRPGTACIPEKKGLSANTPTFLSSASVASANAGLVWASASASSPTAIERGGSLGRLGLPEPWLNERAGLASEYRRRHSRCLSRLCRCHQQEAEGASSRPSVGRNAMKREEAQRGSPELVPC